jgi:hypothetical protein
MNINQATFTDKEKMEFIQHQEEIFSKLRLIEKKFGIKIEGIDLIHTSGQVEVLAEIEIHW